jgi:hypothetical protein
MDSSIPNATPIAPTNSKTHKISRPLLHQLQYAKMSDQALALPLGELAAKPTERVKNNLPIITAPITIRINLKINRRE